MQIILFLLVILFGTVSNLEAQVCEETEQRHAHHIYTSVSGEKTFSESVNDKWTFKLLKNAEGWSIRLYGESGVDLSEITPPYQFGNNPRNIFGWHFRNHSNTGSNNGSVNAAQTFREFIFSEGLEGTGGFRSSGNLQENQHPTATDGKGWVNIVDYGLSDLEKDQKARMVYMKFAACITWPKTEEEIREEQNFKSHIYLDEEKEQIRVCGLDASYELDAYVKPRTLAGDIDGDDAADLFYPIVRSKDHRRGIAVCRAGTWLDILGMDDTIGEILPSDYLTQLESWSLVKDRDVSDTVLTKIQSLNNTDFLVLERIEKSRYFIYWDGKAYQSYEDFVFVEP